MKKMLVLLFVGYVTVVCGQNNNTIVGGVVIPPSPTSSVFRQFAGHTPSLATGTVNVEIDLFDINVKGLSLPFRMQYCTSGISVFDVPYPLGYGWILHPGLRITRTILGRNDGYDVGITSDRILYEMPIKQQIKTLQEYSQDSEVNVKKDSEYDIYTIHLPDENHRFIIKENKVISFNNTLKFAFDGETFTVTDKNGIIYYFGGNGYTEMCDPVITSWMINKIVLPNNNSEIKFTWKPYNCTGMAKYTMPKIDSSISRYTDILPFEKDPVDSLYKDNGRYHDIDRMMDLLPFDTDLGGQKNALFLSKVEFPLGYAEISYTTQGYHGGPMMTSVNLWNSEKELVREIIVGRDSPSDKLIKYIGISDIGKYTFDYYPFKRNKSFDHTKTDYWGFNNDTTDIFTFYAPYPPLILSLVSYKDYNKRYSILDCWKKDINEAGMKQGMLQRITYPTGGYSEFEYEMHQLEKTFQTQSDNIVNPYQINEGGGLRISKMTAKPNSENREIIRQYKYGKDENGKAKCRIAPTGESFFSANQYFSFKHTGTLSKPIMMESRKYRKVGIHSVSNYRQYSLGSVPNIFYEEVAEYLNDGTKTIYKYEGEHDPVTKIHIAGFLIPVQGNLEQLFSKAPYIQSKTIFSTISREKIKTTKYNYSEIIEPVIEALQVIRKTNMEVPGGGPDLPLIYLKDDGSTSFDWLFAFPDMLNGSELYYYKSYYLLPKYKILNKVEYTEHYGTLEKTAETVYQYYKDIVTSVEKRENGETISLEEYEFPFNSITVQDNEQKILLQNLKECNMLTYPSVIRNKRNTAIQQKTIYYKDWSNEVLGNKGAIPFSFIYPEKEFARNRNGEDELRLQYIKYDVYGNPIYIRKDELYNTFYYWGYKGQNLLGEVKTGAHGKTPGLSADDFLGYFNPTYYHNKIIRSYNDFIFSNNMDVFPYRDVDATFYLERPLAGIHTIVHPDQTYSTYEYDFPNRLRSISHSVKGKQKEFSYNTVCPAYPPLEVGNIQVGIRTAIRRPGEIHVDKYTLPVSGGSGAFRITWAIEYDKTKEQKTFANNRLEFLYSDYLSFGEYNVYATIEDLKTGSIEKRNNFFIIAPRPQITEISRSMVPGKKCVIKYSINNPGEFVLKGKIETFLSGYVPVNQGYNAYVGIDCIDAIGHGGGVSGELNKLHTGDLSLAPGLSEMTVLLEGTTYDVGLSLQYKIELEGFFIFEDAWYNQ